MQPIETARLRLREMRLDDAAFIVELLNEPAFIANIGDKNARDIEGARRYLAAGPLASYAKHGHGLWHVALKDTGEAIGICGLLRRDGLDDPDVGFAFLARHWNRGQAAEAGAACLAYGYGMLGLQRIVGIVKPDNRASQRVLEKIGLVYERTVQLPGLPAGDYLFAPPPA
jgi:RimJ/RimL family protein N-acetyltransferase